MYPLSFYQAVSNRETEIAEVEVEEIQPVSDTHPIPHISSLFNTGVILELVCGEDERKRFDGTMYPYRMICRLVINLDDGSQYFGTGFFVSPRCVITSGHCVYVHSSWVNSIIVIPGANGSGDERPFGSSVSKVFKSVEGWTVNKNRNFDYGAIILPDNTLFEKVKSYFKVGLVKESEFLYNSGYPLDVNKDKEQWGSSGEVTKLTTHRIYYEIDTEGGNSGSPLYIMNDGQPVVVGVHSFGECPNFCVRADESALEHWEKWSQL